jgi:hypothetical protein
MPQKFILPWLPPMDDSKDRRLAVFLLGDGAAERLERWRSILSATETFFHSFYTPKLNETSFLQQIVPASAAEAVARTCWALWKDQPERIWNIVAEWTDQGAALDMASFQLLITGSELGHLSFDSAVETLGTWLAEGPQKSHAAACLLPPVLASMPPHWNANKLQDWTEHPQPHLLRDLVLSLFSLKPEPCIRLFFAWAQDERHRFDGILVDCLQNLPVPEHESAVENRNIEAKFRHLREIVGKTNPRLTRKIDQFRQRLHDATGKKANDPPRRASGSRGPGPDRKR